MYIMKHKYIATKLVYIYDDGFALSCDASDAVLRSFYNLKITQMTSKYIKYRYALV
jgi:hypothetical protein